MGEGVMGGRVEARAAEVKAKSVTLTSADSGDQLQTSDLSIKPAGVGDAEQLLLGNLRGSGRQMTH